MPQHGVLQLPDGLGQFHVDADDYDLSRPAIGDADHHVQAAVWMNRNYPHTHEQPRPRASEPCVYGPKSVKDRNGKGPLSGFHRVLRQTFAGHSVGKNRHQEQRLPMAFRRSGSGL